LFRNGDSCILIFRNGRTKHVVWELSHTLIRLICLNYLYSTVIMQLTSGPELYHVMF